MFFPSCSVAHRNPESWIRMVDEESGLPYYFNLETGDSEWITDNDKGKGRTSNWIKNWDADGNPYYFNEVNFLFL